MAKSKNHSNHNQAHKNHRNGIRRPVANVYESLKCVIKKFKIKFYIFIYLLSSYFLFNFFFLIFIYN